MLAEDTVNHKITVRYDGALYFGWQRLKDKPTLQGTIEATLERVFGRPCPITGSGRTDRGAHAQGQVFSVRLPGDKGIDVVKHELDEALPSTIGIVEMERVADDFHALNSASGKVYRYEIWNTPCCPAFRRDHAWHIPGALAVASMRDACEIFVGERDFASFATRPNFKQKSTRRHVRRVDLVHDGPQITLTMEADGFLYKMVRNIVRAVVKVGEGRYELAELRAIFDARDRRASPGTAPARGLYLDAVRYG
ncbi:MAG: tRNA pseudouridine(38-40) synthase TruA [Nannocystaceae bacterium]